MTWLAAWSEVGAARQAKFNAALRVRPLTILITIVAVLVSRAINFLPGFIVVLFLTYAIFNATGDTRKAEQRSAVRSLAAGRDRHHRHVSAGGPARSAAGQSAGADGHPAAQTGAFRPG